MNKKFLWALLISAFIGLRMLTILTAIERISYPDSLGAGTMAKEIIEGLKMPLANYQPDYYTGEPLLMDSLTVFSFKIFGPTLFALKWAHLIYALFIFAAAAFLIYRWFGSQAALIVSTLLVFCPPSVTQAFLMPVVAHSESVLESLLTLIAFAFFINTPSSLFRLMTFGLLAGFSFWVYPQTLIVSMACLGSWFLYERASFFSRRLGYFLFFALIGMAPWWIDNFNQNFRGMSFLAGDTGTYLAVFTGSGVLMIFKKLFRFFTSGFFISFSTFDAGPIPAVFYSYAYGLSCLAALALVLKRFKASDYPEKSRPLAAALLIYFPLFTAVFAVSRYDAATVHYFFDLRYFTTLIFFTIILSGLGIAGSRYWKIFFAFFLALGIAGQAPMLFQQEWGRGLHYRGYSYTLLGNRISHFVFPYEKFYRDYPDIAGWLAPENRFDFLRGALQLDFGICTIEVPGEAKFQIPEEWPEAQKALYIERLAVARGYQDFKKENLPEIWNNVPEKFKPSFIRGFVRTQDFAKPALTWDPAPFSAYQDELCLHAGLTLDGEDPSNSAFPSCKNDSSFFRGAADSYFCEDCPYQPSFEKFLRDFPNSLSDNLKPHAQDLAWGLGWRFRKFFSEDRLRGRDWLHRLPKDYWKAAEQGFAAAEQTYGLLT